MNDISKEILEKYQIRKTKKQKLAFIDYIKAKYPQVNIEEGGFPNNRNIIIGDVDKAKIIFTAHYDTCAVLPFPNLIFPRNIFFTVIYTLLICIPFFAVMYLSRYLMSLITDIYWVESFVSFAIFLVLFLVVFVLGEPNKHTANDNTSGVVSVLELYETLSDEDKDKCAFILFDNEENGLLGSFFFRKRHKNVKNNTFVINLDCVGDGDNLMFVMPKKRFADYGNLIKQSMEEVSKDRMNVLLCSSSTTMYPSDQAGFVNGVGVAALRKKKFFGYYLGRIHTGRDTVCEERNISFITEGLKILVLKYNSL